MSDKLKPCLCGKEARFVQCAFGKWSVHCSSGECFSLEGEHRTKDQARDDWNRRQPEAKALTVDWIEAELDSHLGQDYGDTWSRAMAKAAAQVIHAALPPVRPVVTEEQIHRALDRWFESPSGVKWMIPADWLPYAVKAVADELATQPDQSARIAELEGLLATERSQALGFEKLYHREQGTTALLQADRDALVAAVKELRSDLFLQIEPKHGPKAASEYPSIVYANKVIASIKAGQPAKEEL